MVSWHLLGLTAPGELKFGRLKLDAWPMLDELHKANKKDKDQFSLPVYH